MSGTWQHGLCSCFDNCTICIISYFIPCYQFGKNAEAVGESCMMCGLVFLVASPIVGAIVRGKIRETKGIPGSFVGDLIVWCCIPLCALIQEGQEVEGMGQRSMVRE